MYKWKHTGQPASIVGGHHDVELESELGGRLEEGLKQPQHRHIVLFVEIRLELVRVTTRPGLHSCYQRAEIPTKVVENRIYFTEHKDSYYISSSY